MGLRGAPLHLHILPPFSLFPTLCFSPPLKQIPLRNMLLWMCNLLVPNAPPQCLVEGSVCLYLVPLLTGQQATLPTMLVIVLSLQLNLYVATHNSNTFHDVTGTKAVACFHMFQDLYVMHAQRHLHSIHTYVSGITCLFIMAGKGIPICTIFQIHLITTGTHMYMYMHMWLALPL